MVYFDLARILWGIPISLLWGIFTSLLVSLERILISFIPFYINSFSLKIKDKRFKEFLNTSLSVEFSSPVTCFLGVITVFLVYILLSYIMLFGQIRIYLFLGLLLGFFISERFISRYALLFVKLVLSTIAFITLKFVFCIYKIGVFILKKLEFIGKVEKTIDNGAEIL